MYSRSYNRDQPFTVPKQYSGVAFSRPRAEEKPRERPLPQKPPLLYSQEAGERLYLPGDLPQVKVLPPERREQDDVIKTERTKPYQVQKSFGQLISSLGEDTVMLCALILLLAGCDGSQDAVMLLVLLLILG